MFSKKTLSAAVAVALSLGINTSAQAAAIKLSEITFNLCQRSATTLTDSMCAANTDTLKYAYEQFGSADVTLSFPFRARYRPSTSNLGKGYDFYVTYTLSGGAVWGRNLSSSDFNIQTQEGTNQTTTQISLVAGGSTKDSTVSFRVNTSSTSALSTANILDFNFYVGKAQNVLKTPGGQITLTTAFKVAQTNDPVLGNKDADSVSRTVPLASSIAGATVTFEFVSLAKAYIDVMNDGKTFVGSGIAPTAVDYGAIKIAKTSGGVLKAESTLPQDATIGLGTAATAIWTPSIDKLKLTIENGNFNASGVPSEGKVYIKVDSSGSLKLNATSFSTDKLSAEWNLSKADSVTIGTGITMDAALQKLVGSSADSAHDIMLGVNGTDSILENRKNGPRGTLVIQYTDVGSTPISLTANLRHLKRNGSVCTLYNIPESGALDILNIRITNDSPSVSGFVKGTLRTMDDKGNVVETLKSKMLVDVGGLAPHQTIHLGSEELASNGETWKGRGVLTLESNIPDPYLQVYGMLRAKIVGAGDMLPESPLMNMSTGATGNGCD